MNLAFLDAHAGVLFLVLAVALIALAVFMVQLFLGFTKFRMRYEGVAKAVEAGNLAEAIVQQSEDIGHVQNDIVALDKVMRKIAKDLTGAVQKTALIRFDAFDDVGGKLSFAVALLNERADGLVVSSINGRQESRIYAKPVKAGESIYNLSAEEKEAIGQALR